MASRTSRSISALLSSCLLLMAAPLTASAGSVFDGLPLESPSPHPAPKADSVVVVVDSTSLAGSAEAVAEALGKTPEKKARFFNGFGVGVDFVGLVQKSIGADWAQMEVLARMNIRERFFPVFELGLGEADHEGRDLDNHFHVRSPYFRLGCDYNIRYKHLDGYRFFVGLRYGFSFYKYDLTSPSPITDPVWGTSQPFDLQGLSGNAHWAEVVIGLETRLWSIIRLGWDIRFKLLITQKAHEVGQPWYIPGLGKQPDGIGWGGTFKLMFDI